MRPTLKELFEAHQGKLSDKWGSYIPEYERILSAHRDTAIKILEIGVQNGGSLEIWSQFFKQAEQLIGCDLNTKCADLKFENPTIIIVTGDVNTDDAERQILSHTSDFDIIIDDGSHHSGDIVHAFTRYFPHLKDDGIYIVEDLHCSYWQDFDGGLYNPYSSLAFFKLLIDAINHEHWGIDKTRSELLQDFAIKYRAYISEEQVSRIHSIEFLNSMCIIRKSPPAKNELGRRVVSGTIALVDTAPLNAQGSNLTVPNQKENRWAADQMASAASLICQIEGLLNSNMGAPERPDEIRLLNEILNHLKNYQKNNG